VAEGVRHCYSRALDKLNVGNSDQQVGIDIVRKALEFPARQIAENVGAEGSLWATCGRRMTRTGVMTPKTANTRTWSRPALSI
jgi:hypothetical protein